jgi:hypothetical protein
VPGGRRRQQQQQQITAAAMRFSALLPIAFIATAFVLTFLCLFAGSSRGFMQDYAILTLNTSRLGYLEAFNRTSDNAILK